MKELEKGFFEDIAKDLKAASQIGNFQQEVVRDEDKEALLDYVADATDTGFRIDEEKVEKLNMDTMETLNNFIDQKMQDIEEEATKKWSEG